MNFSAKSIYFIHKFLSNLMFKYLKNFLDIPIPAVKIFLIVDFSPKFNYRHDYYASKINIFNLFKFCKSFPFYNTQITFAVNRHPKNRVPVFA